LVFIFNFHPYHRRGREAFEVLIANCKLQKSSDMNVSRCFWYGALLFLSTTTVARSEERTTKSPYESLYPLFALDPLHRSQRKRNETLVLSAAVVVNESVPFNFDCSRREGAFTKHGPAVQIIHVPKSGGTSIRCVGSFVHSLPFSD
jgi:hypothetical protein